jgi:hypothetical protein
MTPKRPRDPNQLAKLIIDIATGQQPSPVDTRDPDRRGYGQEGREGARREPDRRAAVRDRQEGHSKHALKVSFRNLFNPKLPNFRILPSL